MPEQLPLPLPRRRALGREDFFVSPANAEVVAMLGAVGTWPGGRLVIVGPPGAGKSHLAQVFAAETGATVLQGADLAAADLPDIARGPLALDDAGKAAEEPLFHLYNLMGETRQPLLMTARLAPAHWNIALPDLASRLASVTAVKLGQPDDTLFTAVLAKHFADRQISPPANLIPYLVDHMERSLSAAGAVVAEIDRLALAEARPIGRALAARILDKGGGGAA